MTSTETYAGYSGSQNIWSRFLAVVAQKIDGKGDFEVSEPVSKEEIVLWQRHNKLSLPNSYIDFISVCGGIARISSLGGEASLVSVDRLHPLSMERPAFVESWAKIADSNNDGAIDFFSKLGDMFLISNFSMDGFALYNPFVVADDGEWEVALILPMAPDIIKFPSFCDYMRNILYKLIEDPALEGPYSDKLLNAYYMQTLMSTVIV